MSSPTTREREPRSDSSVRDVIIGTAGHIDHGKTALVRALTGIDTDRLPDEKRTGMTIDLGFAPLDLGPVRAGIVDVPGHERFIKNMVAGATGVDLALLVVAVDDSVMPQTLEHLETLELLGVTEGVIALTKTDLATPEQVGAVEEEIREWVAGTAFEGKDIVPVSVVTGRGLEALRAKLTDLVHRARQRPPGEVFRLPVDRAFTISGAGTVVTGSVLSGMVRVGDTVEVLPLRRRVRVRGIQRHDEPQEEARAGQRAALNLAGIDYQELSRRYELATPGYLEPASTLEVHVQCLAGAAQSFRLRSSVHLCLGTGDVLARIVPLEDDELKPGRKGLAQIHTEQPVVAEHGQRFILRSTGTGRVVGGGRVLRPVSRKRRRRDTAGNRSLHVLADGDAGTRLAETLRLAGTQPTSPLPLCRDAGIAPSKLPELLAALEAAGEVVSVSAGGRRVPLHKDTVQRLERLCCRLAREYQAAHPLEPGIPEAQLSSQAAPMLPEPLWPAIRDRLMTRGLLKRTNDRLATPDFEVHLSPAARRLKDACRNEIHEGWFSPPAESDLPLPANTTPADRRAVLELLQLEGEIVKIAGDLWMNAAALKQAQTRIADEVRRTGPLSVAQIRDLLRTSRRYAVPLCEYLDHVRFTRRVGDLRTLVESGREAEPGLPPAPPSAATHDPPSEPA